MIRLLIAGTGLLLASCSIQVESTSTNPDDRPDCSGQVITVQYGEQFPCNINPPQVILEVGTNPDDCLDFGGQPMTDRNGGNYCFDLDY